MDKSARAGIVCCVMREIMQETMQKTRRGGILAAGIWRRTAKRRRFPPSAAQESAQRPRRREQARERRRRRTVAGRGRRKSRSEAATRGGRRRRNARNRGCNAAKGIARNLWILPCSARGNAPQARTIAPTPPYRRRERAPAKAAAQKAIWRENVYALRFKHSKKRANDKANFYGKF